MSPNSARDVARPDSSAGGAVVLFDGTCAFCEGAVKFIAARDPRGYFRFGASQSPQAVTLLASHGVSRQTARSMILIEDGRVYLRSTASLRIARRLTYPWALLSGFLVIPRPLRDAAYKVVAAIRHRVAGPSTACDIPPPEIRDRLI